MDIKPSARLSISLAFPDESACKAAAESVVGLLSFLGYVNPTFYVGIEGALLHLRNWSIVLDAGEPSSRATWCAECMPRPAWAELIAQAKSHGGAELSPAEALDTASKRAQLW